MEENAVGYKPDSGERSDGTYAGDGYQQGRRTSFKKMLLLYKHKKAADFVQRLFFIDCRL
jgi:hypothetical protein